jgi:cytochrome c-type biogenesis protein CcmE
MKGLKKKRRIQVIVVAALALAISTAMIGYAMRDGINFFRSPSQIAENPPPETEVFRIGGLVEAGSIRRQGDLIEFRVTDGAHSIPARYNGVPPDLFNENEGTVATGRLVDGVFIVQPNGLLARHDETYMPREVVQALEAQGVWRPDGSGGATHVGLMAAPEEGQGGY